MRSRWGFLLGRRKAPLAQTGGDSDVKAAPMHEVGQRNELLHVRFSYMADRLEDLKSLSDEFHELSKPIEEIVEELPRNKARILEMEALLSRELQESQRAKSELREIAEKHLLAANENSGLINRSRALQEALDRSETTRDGHQIRLAELAKLFANSQQQLTAEADNRQRVENEFGVLTAELTESRDTLKALEDINERQVERNHQLDRELHRVQGVVEKQVLSVVDLQARNSELERVAQERTQDLAQLHHRIENDHTERQRSENGMQLSISALQAERSSLALRVDALQARLDGSEQMLAQTREQLAEKDAAVRQAEEAIWSAERERGSLSREVAVLGQNSSNAASQLEESQRLAENLSKRCDMLSKALAAKDAALENAVDKARLRSERVDQLTKRFEQEKSVLEAAHRRLLEELENEKAERTLAQGALKIARESRASLQRLNESLKRQNRSILTAVDSGMTADDRPDVGVEDSSNVSKFAPPPRDRHGPDPS